MELVTAEDVYCDSIGLTKKKYDHIFFNNGMESFRPDAVPYYFS